MATPGLAADDPPETAVEAAPSGTDVADANTEPLWEAGAGGVLAYAPDYPASDESSLRGIAFPYFIYRGDFLQVTERGQLRGIFLDSPRYEIDASVAAAFPVDSDENGDREGMPDLDFLFEVGPRVGIWLVNDAEFGRTRLDFAVRGVFSTDFSNVGFEGWVFSPALSWRRDFEAPIDFNMRLGVTSIFATERLQDYFYGVPAKDARPGRPRYDAKAGYLGSFFNIGFRFPLTARIRWAVGTRIGYFEGAANQDSPLFQRTLTGSVFTALIVRFAQSERRVAQSRTTDD